MAQIYKIIWYAGYRQHINAAKQPFPFALSAQAKVAEHLFAVAEKGRLTKEKAAITT